MKEQLAKKFKREKEMAVKAKQKKEQVEKQHRIDMIK